MIAFAKPEVTTQPLAVTGMGRHAVVFHLNAKAYALPVAQVREVIRVQEITPLPKSPAFVEGVISLRGRVLAVIDLRRQFGLPRAEHTQQTRILILRLATSLVGLIVDSVEEVLNIPADAIQQAPAVVTTQLSAQYFKGIARIGAKLVVLLDPTAILSNTEAQQLEDGSWRKSS